MLPLQGVPLTLNLNIGDISGNYERIFTKFSANLSTNTGCQFYVKKSLNMLPPPGAAPPNSNISNISGNYERISTIFSAICLQTRVMSIT